MPKKLTFTGAYLTGSGMSLDEKKGAKTVRLNWKMKWSKPNAATMGWAEPGNGQSTVKLSGGMAVHALAFEVGGKIFNLGSGLFRSWVVVKTSEEDEARPTYELHGQYTSVLPGILGTAEKYVDTMSRAQGKLQMEYDSFSKLEQDEAQQASLLDNSDEAEEGN